MVTSSHRSPVAFPFPPTKIPSAPHPAWWICWAGPGTPRRWSPKWDMVSRHGLEVIPGPALQVSNLSQDVTSASAELQQVPVGLILHPAEWPPCSPVWCYLQNAKTHCWLWESPRQTSEAGGKGVQILECPTHVGAHLHKPLAAFGGWSGTVRPHPSQDVSQSWGGGADGTESFHSIPETLFRC